MAKAKTTAATLEAVIRQLSRELKWASEVINASSSGYGLEEARAQYTILAGRLIAAKRARVSAAVKQRVRGSFTFSE